MYIYAIDEEKITEELVRKASLRIIKKKTVRSDKSSKRIPCFAFSADLFSRSATEPSRISKITDRIIKMAKIKLLKNKKYIEEMPKIKLRNVKIFELIPCFRKNAEGIFRTEFFLVFM